MLNEMSCHRQVRRGEKSALYGKKSVLISLICLIAFTLTSCSGSYTDVSGSWTKPGYKGRKFKNILVVAISNDIIKRNIVESAVVKELGSVKVKSSTSTSILDLSKLSKDKEGKLDSTNREEIRKTLNDAGYDGALVISLLDIKEKTEYVPGQTYYQPNYYGSSYYYGGFYNYYYRTYNVVSTPGYYVDKKYIYIETRLFDLTADDMLWAMKSESQNPSSLKEFSSSLAIAVVNSLINDKAVR